MKEGDNCLNEECNGVYELKSKCKSGICGKRLRCNVCNGIPVSRRLIKGNILINKR